MKGILSALDAYTSGHPFVDIFVFFLVWGPWVVVVCMLAWLWSRNER